MKRRTRVLEETRSTSGAWSDNVGAGSVVGTGVTGTPMDAWAGASDGVAGFDLSTTTVPLISNSRPSSMLVFGNATYAGGLPAQVFHGAVNDAVEPDTTNGCATAPCVFA